MTTVESLRKSGSKVRVMHQRYSIDGQLHPIRYFRDNSFQNLLSPKGGRTDIQITTTDGKDYQVQSFCNKVDAFNRKLAIRICMGRFEKQLNENQ